MSTIVLVLERPESWPLEVPGVELVAARSYLTDAGFADRRSLRVFNLCRSYRYQSLGYYVSLLAEARGHQPLPSVNTIQDLKSRSLVRFLSDSLDASIQDDLAKLAGDRLTLFIYFGQSPQPSYRRLALRLFNLFPAPLLRAELARRGGRWRLESLHPVAGSEIPEDRT